MSEVFSFRIFRAPQRLAPTLTASAYPPRTVLEDFKAARLQEGGSALLPKLAGGGRLAERAARDFRDGPKFLGGGAALPVPLRPLDVWLASRDNRVRPAELIASLGDTPANLVADAGWNIMRLDLGDSLVAATVASTTASIRSELTRLILLAHLIEDLAINPTPVTTEDDVFARLRWRTIIVPKVVLEATPSKARLARRYGMSEYTVIRDEWHEYRLGEIAHIENALAGEMRKRVHKRTTDSETVATTEQDVTKSEEHDLQTTDRLELSEHASQDISIAAHIDGKVSVQAQYGTAKIEVQAGGSFDYAKREAREQATTQAHETVGRAVQKVEQRVRTLRTTRQRELYEETNLHKIDNTQQGATARVAIYRWVDKIQRMQAFHYPHRLLLEFQVPDPGAFVRWRRAHRQEDFMNPKPPAFVALDAGGVNELIDGNGQTRPLAPSDFTAQTWLQYARRYRIGDLEPPPADSATKAIAIDFLQTATAAGYDKSTEDPTRIDLVPAGEGQQGGAGIMLPSGYRLTGWALEIQTYMAHPAKNADATDAVVGQGSQEPIFKVAVDQDVVSAAADNAHSIGGVPTLFRATFALPADRAALLESVPMTIWCFGTREFRAHLSLRLARMQDHLTAWQLRTFERISAEHRAAETRYLEEKTSRAVGDGVTISGESPTRNAEVVREEMKRAVIRLVSNGTYPISAAVTQTDDPEIGPEFDLDDVVRAAREIQFVEQAFEWENLTYVLYPYFWSNKAQWTALADIAGADPEFARFLRSGSARVVVPARPKFEDQVRMYVDTGALWGGGPVPAVGDEEYLSIAEEIKAQQRAGDQGEPGDWWDIKLPTSLVAIDTRVSLPFTNPSPSVGPQPPAPAPEP